MMLSNYFEVIGGGTPKTSHSEYWNGNIPWLSVKDFCGDKKYVYTTEKTITEEGLNNSSTKLLQKDDIIISARGTVGELSMIPFPMAFNQSCFGLKVKYGNDPHFVYYLLQDSIRFLRAHTTGSVFDTITKTTFDQIECREYDKQSQVKISRILSSLDNKIETNNKINANLEEMAQAIFKNWFVDFAPFKDGKFVESELGMIPEGWRVGTLTEIIKLLPGGTPKTTEPSFWDNGNIPFFSPKDVTGIYCYDTEKHITEAGLNKCSSGLYAKDTIFITCRGTVGKITMSACDMAMNQSNYAIKGIDGYSQYYIFFIMRSIVERLLKKANGAVFSAITTKDFDEAVIIPPLNVIKDFDECIKSTFTKIYTIGKENARLASIRDTLLPRLMSGEIEV